MGSQRRLMLRQIPSHELRRSVIWMEFDLRLTTDRRIRHQTVREREPDVWLCRLERAPHCERARHLSGRTRLMICEHSYCNRLHLSPC